MVCLPQGEMEGEQILKGESKLFSYIPKNQGTKTRFIFYNFKLFV